MKPRIGLPLHGEHRHLVEHAKWAKTWGAAHAVVAPNGTLVRLDGNAPGPEDHIETGRVYVDGATQVGALDGVIRERLKLARQGLVICSVVVDEGGELVADPLVRCMGAPKDGENWTAPLDEMIADAVDDALEGAPKASLRTDQGVEELAGRAIRRVSGQQMGQAPCRQRPCDAAGRLTPGRLTPRRLPPGAPPGFKRPRSRCPRSRHRHLSRQVPADPCHPTL